MKIIACNSNKPLAENIANQLNMPLVDATITTFPDQEIFVELQENVRGEDVFVIQSTSFPANNNIMELLVTLDALKRASARRVTAVIPYFGYARQDRKSTPRTPISAKLVANIITSAGADRVLTMDLHAGQIQGFFDIPVDNLFARPVFVKDIKENYSMDNLVMVAPDVGGVARARSVAKKLNVDLCIIDKRRDKPGESEVMNVVGNVEGKNCILVDDIVDSGGTLCNAAQALQEKGASSVSAYITHGVLSGKANEKITNSVLQELVVTDSINIPQNLKSNKKIRVLPIDGIFADAIKRITDETSVSSLFE